MREIEVKFLEIEKQKLIEKLESLGAKLIQPETIMKDKAYDFSDGSIIKDRNLLRLRKVDDKMNILTYKDDRKHEDGFISMEETEVSVDDFEEMHTMLEKLGLRCFRTREKKRTSYVLDDVRVEIDELPGFDPYAEFEGTPETIKNVVEKLGMSMDDAKAMTTTDFLRRFNMNKKDIRF